MTDELTDWRSIRGWGDFTWPHAPIFERLPDGAVVVELGVAYGRGLCLMAALAKEAAASGRAIRVIGVDHFQGTPGENPGAYHNLRRSACEDNMRAAGLSGYAEIIEGDTATAADSLRECHYVFVDADHSFDGVCRDIDAWWPKVVPGGWIGGHDFPHATVRAAVLSRFPSPEAKNGCWLQAKA